jgi:hypothetical protein
MPPDSGKSNLEKGLPKLAEQINAGNELSGSKYILKGFTS